MAWLLLYCITLFITVTLSVIGPTGDLTCTKKSWSVVSGNWSFPKACVYENTNSIHGAMSWLGEVIPSSIKWSDYTVQMVMTPTDTSSSGGNGGLAFNIQEVGACVNCGKYYAISIFPTFQSNQIEVHVGKWNDHYQTVATWFIDDTHTDGDFYDIKAVISTKVNVTVNVYVNDNFLGTWIDDSWPFWKKGSIGMRNYLLPATFTRICVNGCGDEDIEEGVFHGAGWGFIGFLFGGFFLYCCCGYAVNAHESQNYHNCRRNMPHRQFWKRLPRLVRAGCQVSCESLRGLNRRVYRPMK